MWFDMMKSNHESCGLSPIRKWKSFKELFFQQFLRGNFNSFMRHGLLRHKQSGMTITEFKAKFDKYVSYFPSWIESDRVEFFVENLRDSIKYKINPHVPKTLDEAYGLAMNFEKEVSSHWEGNGNRFGKGSIGSSFQSHFF